MFIVAVVSLFVTAPGSPVLYVAVQAITILAPFLLIEEADQSAVGLPDTPPPIEFIPIELSGLPVKVIVGIALIVFGNRKLKIHPPL